MTFLGKPKVIYIYPRGSLKTPSVFKFLVIIIDSNLKFDEYVSSICIKVNRKLTALTMVMKFLDIN